MCAVIRHRSDFSAWGYRSINHCDTAFHGYHSVSWLDNPILKPKPSAAQSHQPVFCPSKQVNRLQEHAAPSPCCWWLYIKSIGSLLLQELLWSRYDSLRIITIMSIYKVDPKVIESIPLTLLKTIPAETPPLRIQPDFVNSTTRIPVILGINSVSCLSYFLLLHPNFYEACRRKKWKWDGCERNRTKVRKRLGLKISISDLLVRFRETIRLCSSAQISDPVA